MARPVCTESQRHNRSYNGQTPIDKGPDQSESLAADSHLYNGGRNILSTIDTAIEQTEALIEKYQHIKAGLMHDLFTRGVLPNGQLRPPREQAPELYQETAIGWIPREWQYELLDNLAHRGSGHTPNKDHPEYWNGGIKWVSLADSISLDQLYISDTELEISHKGIANSSAVLHPAGIVVLSRDAGVGKSAITTEPMRLPTLHVAVRPEDGPTSCILAAFNRSSRHAMAAPS